MTASEKEQYLAWATTAPVTIPCPDHAGQFRPIDETETWTQWVYYRELKPMYSDCPQCKAAKVEARHREIMRQAGVPEILLGASVGSWTPRTDKDREAIAKVSLYVKRAQGTMILVGDIGTGKTHLAIGILRELGGGRFVKASTCLRELRRSYDGGPDPVVMYQSAKALVIDDIGFSGGGKDEIPMLHEIIDHRNGERMPTILTGNCTLAEIPKVLGERMADRLRQAAVAVELVGESMRAKTRKEYWQE